MTNPSLTPTRSVWLVIWVALTIGTIVYGVLSPMVAPDAELGPPAPRMRVPLVGAAVLGFVLATILMRGASRAADAGRGLLGLRPKGELATPGAFQLRSLLAMALFESVAVYGFVLAFLGARLEHVWLFCIAGLAGMVGVALPAGLAYWREVERVPGSGATPIG